MAELTDRQLNQYARQLVLPQVDLEGQLKLQSSRMLIVGAGGLGVPLAQYLAAAGVGYLRLVDDDVIERSNLPRQVAFAESDIGQAKVDVLAARLRSNNADVELDTRLCRFESNNASALLEDIHLVVDATDSAEARLLIDRSTFDLRLPWIMGAAVRLAGQWTIFDADRQFGCYHCLMTDGSHDGAGGCAELGILGPVVGLVALQQALLAIKWCLGADLPWGRLQLLDAWGDEQTQISLMPRDDCPVCRVCSDASR